MAIISSKTMPSRASEVNLEVLETATAIVVAHALVLIGLEPIPLSEQSELMCKYAHEPS